MAEVGFAELVQLACHDLRTPLATVSGFAKTMGRSEQLAERDAEFVGLIDEAATQMSALVSDVGLAARIAAGRYEPYLVKADTLELASSGDGRIRAEGAGATVETDAATFAHALEALALAALRFGEAASVTWAVSGRELALSPVAGAEAALDGSSAADLGALVGRAALAALGAEVVLEGDSLRVRI
jgi:signal transduction histidine kinase